MQYKKQTWGALLLALPLVAAKPRSYLSPANAKRDDSITWGPLVGMGPPATDGVTITSILATIYPGVAPSTQAGGLFNWIGINTKDDTGDLIQGIVGQYASGQSECSGAKADTEWCISSEVYGPESSSSSTYTQYVGDLTTLYVSNGDGIIFNYTLEDSATGLWTQSAHNAKTGVLLSKYQKVSNYDFVLVNTAVECQSCTAPVKPQYWTDITIGLSGADESFGSTLWKENSATSTTPTTSDSGMTWQIKKVTIPVVTPTAD